MKKKTIVTILIILIIGAAACGGILLWQNHGGSSKPPEPETDALAEEPVHLFDNKLGERPSYKTDDYIQIEGYDQIPLVEEEPETESEAESIIEAVDDMDVQSELLKRAQKAGVDIRYKLDDEDAAIISGQKYQTLDEYKEYLRGILAERKSYASRAASLADYIDRILSKAEISELPENIQKYDEDALALQVERYAQSIGKTVEELEEEGKLTNVKNYLYSQNEGIQERELCLRYIAEKNGISVEEGDYEEMIDFFTRVYGEESITNMKKVYSDARLEAETLYYKTVITLF